ncbi:MAG TPA: redoxin domain-containing protein, partial [Saprospiraceae bacterium]|nr:redoxin domain-containing protein [Saprospiraceae bacterium]
MLTTYQLAPEIRTRTISDLPIDLHKLQGKKVVIKFHRFSGCPVARREIKAFISRQKELFAAGIETIVFLHNTRDKVLPVFTELPGLHVIADRQKLYYEKYHAQFSWLKLLSFASWRVTIAAICHGFFPKFAKFQGGII